MYCFSYFERKSHEKKVNAIPCRELPKQSVPGFASAYERFKKLYVAAGYAESTCSNYLLALSQISLFFGKSFHLLSDQQIADYMYDMRLKKASQSRVKFLVYGYRFLFEVMKTPERRIVIKGNRPKRKLPVVLNQSEIKRLIRSENCPNLKHRLILSLLYSSGLRKGELLNLKIADIDFEAKRILVKDSKHGKSRYAILSKLLSRGLQRYLHEYEPKVFLFNGPIGSEPYSASSVRAILKRAVINAKIEKEITVHSLRHSFAVHFLEQGGNLLQLKGLLGHSQLQSTLIYLRAVQTDFEKVQSPLDVLFQVS